MLLPANSSLEKWLRNGDYHPGNRSKQFQETCTISAAKFEWKRVFYIQTLPRFIVRVSWNYCRVIIPLHNLFSVKLFTFGLLLINFKYRITKVNGVHLALEDPFMLHSICIAALSHPARKLQCDCIAVLYRSYSFKMQWSCSDLQQKALDISAMRCFERISSYIALRDQLYIDYFLPQLIKFDWRN